MSKTRNAYIIDPYSHGSYHEVINQSYLMMISSLYEKVTYIADATSCECLRRLMDECYYDYSNVIFREENFRIMKTGWAGIDYLLRMLIVGWLDYFHYMKVPKDTDVFYNNNIFEGISLISTFSFGKKNRVFDMCHSSMEHIIKKPYVSKPMKLFSWYLRHVFLHTVLPAKLHFLLLSTDMVDYFNQHIIPKNRARMCAIDHAYIRPNNEIEIPSRTGTVINIGIPGAITPDRGLSNLQYILDHAKNYSINIYALSFVKGVVTGNNFVELNKTGKLMPFEEYYANIQKMDMMLFLYDKGSYKLTASGAILEAIWNEKPIIALENQYFRYLFNKFGDMGVLCQSLEELARTLNNIKYSKDFNKYLGNIRYAKQQLMPSQVKNQLKEIIS